MVQVVPAGLPELLVPAGPLSGSLVEAKASQAHSVGAARSATWAADVRLASSVSAARKADHLDSRGHSPVADGAAVASQVAGEAAARVLVADAAGDVRRLRWGLPGAVTCRFWLRRCG